MIKKHCTGVFVSLLLLVLEPLVEHLREFNKVSARFEVWLQEKEAELAECGPIGANLDRCMEQETLLEVR